MKNNIQTAISIACETKEKQDSSLEEIVKSGVKRDNHKLHFPIDLMYVELKSTKNGAFFYNGKRIKILRLGFGRGPNVVQSMKKARSYFIYLLFTDNSRQAIFDVDGAELHHLLKDNITEFKCAGEIVAFAGRVEPSIDWQKQSVKDSYKAVTSTFYEMVRERIVRCFLEIMSKESAPLFIGDLACGEGRLAPLLDGRLADNLHNEVSYFGFDLNKENILVCNEHKIAEFKSCQFILGNLLDTDAILKNEISKFKGQKIITIAVFSGCLTRNVLPNAFDALTALQGAAKNNLKYLIFSGYEELTINDFILRKLGYRNTWHPEKHGQFFLFKRLSNKAILNGKLKKLKEQGILDLSLSHKPEYFIAKLQRYLKDGITIDLSFCSVSDELKFWVKYILEHMDIKIIIWHSCKEFIAYLQDNFGIFSKENFRNIHIKLISDDVYLMAPRNFFTTVQTENPFVKKTLSFMEEKVEYPKRSHPEVPDLEEAVSERIMINIPLTKESGLDYLNLVIKNNHLFQCDLKDVSGSQIFNFIKLYKIAEGFDFKEEKYDPPIGRMRKRLDDVFENLSKLSDLVEINLLFDDTFKEVYYFKLIKTLSNDIYRFPLYEKDRIIFEKLVIPCRLFIENERISSSDCRKSYLLISYIHHNLILIDTLNRNIIDLRDTPGNSIPKEFFNFLNTNLSRLILELTVMVATKDFLIVHAYPDIVDYPGITNLIRICKQAGKLDALIIEAFKNVYSLEVENFKEKILVAYSSLMIDGVPAKEVDMRIEKLSEESETIKSNLQAEVYNLTTYMLDELTEIEPVVDLTLSDSKADDHSASDSPRTRSVIAITSYDPEAGEFPILPGEEDVESSGIPLESNSSSSSSSGINLSISFLPQLNFVSSSFSSSSSSSSSTSAAPDGQSKLNYNSNSL